MKLTLAMWPLLLSSAYGAGAPRPNPRAPRMIYQIFTRSFKSGAGNGVGDLDGVTQSLGYLRWLGVDAIWLTPIFASPSYHGYDTTDFFSVNADYGDDAAFSRLVDAAHRRGLRVLLDVAVNHTSNRHPWFRSSVNGGTDRDLYMWSPEPLRWGQWFSADDGEYYLGSFDRVMPDLNWRNPEVLSRAEKVFLHWAALGADGFRLDAAKHLVKGPQGEENQPETHAIWREIARVVRQNYPNAYFIGEVWDSEAALASYYGQGDELDAAFDFPVAAGLRDSLTRGDAGSFANALRDRVRLARSYDFAAPFAGNHDVARLADVVRGLAAPLKLAMTAVFTLPGTPTLYYGDELGLPGGHGEGDLAQRTPMPWNADSDRGFGGQPWQAFSSDAESMNVEAQKKDPSSLLRHVQRLIHERHSHPALERGTLVGIEQPVAGVVAYWRVDPRGSERALVVLNFGDVASEAMDIVAPDKRISPRGHAVHVGCLAGKSAAVIFQ